jgi:hypothetical protein
MNNDVCPMCLDDTLDELRLTNIDYQIELYTTLVNISTKNMVITQRRIDLLRQIQDIPRNN